MGAQHDDLGRIGCDQSDRFLSVLGRIADVFFWRTDDPRELGLESLDDSVCIIDAQGRLGQLGQFGAWFKLELIDILGRFDQHYRFGSLTHRTDHFVVPLVADQDNRVVIFGEFDRF